RRRHTRFSRDWSSDVCSSDLQKTKAIHAWHFYIERNYIRRKLLNHIARNIGIRGKPNQFQSGGCSNNFCQQTAHQGGIINNQYFDCHSYFSENISTSPATDIFLTRRRYSLSRSIIVVLLSV